LRKNAKALKVSRKIFQACCVNCKSGASSSKSSYMKTFQLAINQPCHENWESMSREEKGRFCAACEKIVVDFSALSDRQLAAYFSGKKSTLCGRFQASQLNRNIVIPPKPVPWLRPIVPLAFSAMTLLLEACSPGSDVTGVVTFSENVIPTASDTETDPMIVGNKSRTPLADTIKPVVNEIKAQVLTEKNKKVHPTFIPVDTMRLPAMDTATKPVDKPDTSRQHLLHPTKETLLMGMVSYTHFKAMKEKSRKEKAKKKPK
jgi:hypothetical protein